MRKIFALLVMLLNVTPVLAATPDVAAPRATIDSFIAAFNKGDIAAAKAVHEATPAIIDEPPPYFWSGRDSFDRWAADERKDAADRGRTDEKVTLGKTRRTEISDTSAYVIVPATYSYTEKGVALAEPSQMTFVLKRGRSGWRISAWSWTGPRGRPVAAKP